jgi:hypothetical protein
VTEVRDCVPSVSLEDDWASDAPTLAAARMKMILRATMAIESASGDRDSRGLSGSMRAYSTIKVTIECGRGASNR